MIFARAQFVLSLFVFIRKSLLCTKNTHYTFNKNLHMCNIFTIFDLLPLVINRGPFECYGRVLQTICKRCCKFDLLPLVINRGPFECYGRVLQTIRKRFCKFDLLPLVFNRGPFECYGRILQTICET